MGTLRHVNVLAVDHMLLDVLALPVLLVTHLDANAQTAYPLTQ
jgi:hypothetical protein